MKYLGAKGDEKNTSYQVYGSVRVKKEKSTLIHCYHCYIIKYEKTNQGFEDREEATRAMQALSLQFCFFPIRLGIRRLVLLPF